MFPFSFPQGSENLEGYSVNVTQKYKTPLKCKPKRLSATTSEYDLYSSSSSQSAVPGSFGILRDDGGPDEDDDDDDEDEEGDEKLDIIEDTQNIRGNYNSGNIVSVNVNADNFSTSRNLVENGKVSRSSATETLGLSSASNLLVEQMCTKVIAMIAGYSFFYSILLNTLNNLR